MFIRVCWAKRDGPTMYHVYQCGDYFVEITGYSGSSDGVSGISSARLMLDGGKHDILISSGDNVYIMNDQGKTVDSILTV